MPSQPSPRNWAAGEMGTAALLNTHIRDSTDFFLSPPHCFMTGSGTTSAGDQTIGTGSWTAVTWATQLVDNFNMWSSGANTLITCKSAGCYAVHGQITYNTPASADSGVRGASIDHLRGGSLFAVPARSAHANSYGWGEDPGPTHDQVVNAAMETVVSVGAYVNLQLNDQIRLMAFQNTGSNLAVLKRGGDYHTYLSVRWIGAL